MSEELRPCPHCGFDGSVLYAEREDMPGSGLNVEYAGCTACGSYSDTVAIWNRRTPDAAREKRMREVADRLRRDAPERWREGDVIRFCREMSAKLLEGLGAEQESEGKAIK